MSGLIPDGHTVIETPNMVTAVSIEFYATRGAARRRARALNEQRKAPFYRVEVERVEGEVAERMLPDLTGWRARWVRWRLPAWAAVPYQNVLVKL